MKMRWNKFMKIFPSFGIKLSFEADRLTKVLISVTKLKTIEYENCNKKANIFKLRVYG